MGDDHNHQTAPMATLLAYLRLEQEEAQALATAGTAVDEAEAGSLQHRAMWYAQMVRLGERRLWMRLLEWLKIFDGLFDLVNSPDLIENYAKDAFQDPETYPLHR